MIRFYIERDMHEIKLCKLKAFYQSRNSISCRYFNGGNLADNRCISRDILDSYPCSQMQYVVLCTWNVWFCFWIYRALKLPLKLKLYFWYQIVKNSIVIERKQPQKIQLKVKLKSAHRNEIFLQKPQPFDGFWYLRWGKKCRLRASP